MGNRIVLTVIFLVFTLCSFGDNVFNGAQWISIPKSQNTPNQWLCFRKQIECADKNTVAKLNIAVDSKYWLWVNDSLVDYISKEEGLSIKGTPSSFMLRNVGIKTLNLNIEI